MNLAYYPGCSVHGMAREYQRSIEQVCARLGITLTDVVGWNCCGATSARNRDRVLSLGLGVRNLDQVARMGFDQVVTPCSGCFSHLRMAAHEVESDESLRLSVEVRSGQKARGGVQVLHLLQFVVERLGLERIEAEVKRPLSGMRLAAYYGCLLTRPSNVLGFDDPEQPTSMDRLLRVLGADSVTWSHKAECCGAGFSASEPGIVLELGSQVLVSAQDGGAQAVVVACPLCQSNLDIRQHEMERRMGVSLNLPVIYFTQLIGLAFGFSPRSLGLGRLVVDPRPALKAWGFR